MGPVGYLVVGPESSGTRMTAGLLRAAGCRPVAIVGRDDGPDVPLDGHPPLVRRSMPHGGRWWTIEEMLAALEVQEVRAVVTMRDWFAMVESQVARRLAPDAEAGFGAVRRAYSEILTGLVAASVPFVLSSYEAMVARPDYGARLLEFLGLPAAALETYDGNAKWYVGDDPKARIAAYEALAPE